MMLAADVNVDRQDRIDVVLVACFIKVLFRGVRLLHLYTA
jgi:hypothetical protein